MKKYDRRKIVIGIIAAIVLIMAAVAFLVFYNRDKQNVTPSQPEVVDEVEIDEVEVEEVEVEEVGIEEETIVPELNQGAPQAGLNTGIETPAAGPTIAEPSAKSLF